jgi:hypothetical protein
MDRYSLSPAHIEKLAESQMASWQNVKWRNSSHHFAILLFRYLICGIDWNRTSDTRIFSPLLYHLSYDAISPFGDGKITKIFEKTIPLR